MELDHSGFTSQYPTVFAGNLGNGKYILQVALLSIGFIEVFKFHVLLNFMSLLFFHSLVLFR